MFSILLSSAVICATPGILVKWDPRNIKSEPEICIKIWPEPLTLTTPTATIRVLSKSALGFSIFWHYRLWEKIKKKHFQKSSRTISENQFDMLIKEALGLGSQPVLTPWTFLACTCPALPPHLCLPPLQPVCVFWTISSNVFTANIQNIGNYTVSQPRTGSHYPPISI